MSEIKLKFLDSINGAIQERKDKLNKISVEIEENKRSIDEKKNTINGLKAKFDETLDNVFTDEINRLNGEIAELEAKNSLLERPFEHTPIIKLDSNALKELERAFNELGFSKIKDDIVKSQETYLKSLEKYNSQVNELNKLRNEIVQKQYNIDLDTRKEISQWFKNKSSELHISINPISNEYGSTENKYLLWINDSASKVSGYNNPFEINR